MNEPAGVDLTDCDREPIHVPGAIQPHGVLLALSPALTVIQASDNLVAHLGIPAEAALGRRVGELVDGASADAVAEVSVTDRWTEANPLRVDAGGKRWDGIVHRHDGVTIVELEPAPARTPTAHTLRPALSAVQQADSVEEVCACAVREVKRLTGFERVMLYRFDEDGHGFVASEAKESPLESYLGLHYPASDIPQQARALYLKNWLRIIPDARYAPARIVPAVRPDTGAPLDLSFSVLRSVSPIHLEYMANMGLRASMSASLRVRGRLWGLISCGHHSGPCMVPYEVRSIVEVLARLLSLQIDALGHRDAAVLRVARRQRQDALAEGARRGRDDDDVLASLLAAGGDDLAELVEAGGVAAVVGEEVSTLGLAPPAPVVRAIAVWLDTATAGAAPYATACLPRLLPAAVESQDVASGVLSFALPGSPSRRLLWFRPEIVRSVTWGGDPHKPAEVDPGARLRPRRSFQQWKEEVRLTSRLWSPADLEAAEELRRGLVEIDLERQVAREQRAVRLRDDLVAIVSHDLRNPLGVIRMQAALMMSAATSDRVHAGAERICRAADRMTNLIRDLLDVARIEADRFEIHLRAEPISEIVNENLLMIAPLATARRLALHQEVLDGGMVRADRERLFQVLSNLLGNAVKFTPEGGAVRLRVERQGDEVLFTVADSGPGIAPEDLPHVFDRYWKNRRGNTLGTGLGLFIAKGIVDRHGGRIWAESAGGARFHFTLPAA